MSSLCFVTAFDNLEPLHWGLDVKRIAVPMVLFCARDVAAVLADRDPSSHVRVVAAAVPRTPSLADKLAWLVDARRGGYHDCDGGYWLDSALIYQHLSFEFLYSDLLERAVRQFAPGPACFVMPGYTRDSFFGGPTAAIEALADTACDAIAALFEPVTGPVFSAPFGTKIEDVNLQLAAAIDEPVLHIIGDSHVWNCFTPNTTIGCRSNVLVRTSDVSRTCVPYAYQFTHHLGSRTMHFAGRGGSLLAIAKDSRLKPGDAAVWVFGEIDARCHILRQQADHGRALDEIIDTLARDYVEEILQVRRAYDGIRCVVFAPIPPLDNPGYTSDAFPICGSIDERVAATRQLRRVLSDLCDHHELSFLDVSAHYESARGDLRWELSDHFCHIGCAAQAPAVEGLYELLTSRPSA